MVSSIGIHERHFLDCLNLKYELVNFPSNWKFCLVDSEVKEIYETVHIMNVLVN